MTHDVGERSEVGLCALCQHGIVQRSAKGSEFWRCGVADLDEGLLRYPPLPVRACPAYAELQDAPES